MKENWLVIVLSKKKYSELNKQEKLLTKQTRNRNELTSVYVIRKEK
jgi:hypothetical protein